ncbi:MAG TPA: tRNA (N(6)-L-threonylcarbamoyladenosine(37)-C(2))-methylthiotransferase MtaB [Candidatus Cybelea sp.]|nr:tRNA (N(6)-L-threonylcarbamoyladenosine(37)-C(2))-methylthiotransferase MtaB [Candidatus Cybelea sp.]
MSGVEIITFGCRLNAYESEVMRANAGVSGLDNAVIVNTCAVTAEAERQARQAIRRARRERPDARIIVTGCAAQIDPQGYAALPEVDQVLGNAEKLRAAAFSPGRDERRIVVDDIMRLKESAGHFIEGFDGRARAFLQVQQGCEHRCTFCIIPYGRGNSRSVPLGLIVEQARKLAASGVPEIVLTGVDITSYGADLPGRPSLGETVRRLLALVPEIRRLRLSSIDPAEADAALFRLIAEEPRLMPHLHLSLQSGDDMILKRMKRRHSRAGAVEFCNRVRRLRPDVAFGADLIAGFPTEDEAMFANTLSLVDECDLAMLHVFPYSARRGTPAARMPQVPVALRKERARRLREAGTAALDRFLATRVGTTAEVVVEDGRMGRSEHYAAVELDRPAPQGAVASARIDAFRNGRLVGRLIGRPAA